MSRIPLTWKPGDRCRVHVLGRGGETEPRVATVTAITDTTATVLWDDDEGTGVAFVPVRELDIAWPELDRVPVEVEP
jgi:hypothetical protein